ncbi:MAG: type II toxin-antitoxin system HicB family antitoxin [Pirellulales bacterium]|nr:type II toxin-antitoxin system HicB family antitoxin [Pirellulales bacterium]
MTTYRVILIESEEGFAVSCPSLKGCHSQGATREEALENVKIAIREWLDAEGAEKSLFHVTEEEVAV